MKLQKFSFQMIFSLTFTLQALAPQNRIPQPDFFQEESKLSYDNVDHWVVSSWNEAQPGDIMLTQRDPRNLLQHANKHGQISTDILSNKSLRFLYFSHTGIILGRRGSAVLVLEAIEGQGGLVINEYGTTESQEDETVQTAILKFEEPLREIIVQVITQIQTINLHYSHVRGVLSLMIGSFKSVIPYSAKILRWCTEEPLNYNDEVPHKDWIQDQIEKLNGNKLMCSQLLYQILKIAFAVRKTEGFINCTYLDAYPTAVVRELIQRKDVVSIKWADYFFKESLPTSFNLPYLKKIESIIRYLNFRAYNHEDNQEFTDFIEEVFQTIAREIEQKKEDRKWLEWVQKINIQVEELRKNHPFMKEATPIEESIRNHVLIKTLTQRESVLQNLSSRLRKGSQPQKICIYA